MGAATTAVHARRGFSRIFQTNTIVELLHFLSLHLFRFKKKKKKKKKKEKNTHTYIYIYPLSYCFTLKPRTKIDARKTTTQRINTNGTY